MASNLYYADGKWFFCNTARVTQTTSDLTSRMLPLFMHREKSQQNTFLLIGLKKMVASTWVPQWLQSRLRIMTMDFSKGNCTCFPDHWRRA